MGYHVVHSVIAQYITFGVYALEKHPTGSLVTCDFLDGRMFDHGVINKMMKINFNKLVKDLDQPNRDMREKQRAMREAARKKKLPGLYENRAHSSRRYGQVLEIGADATDKCKTTGGTADEEFD